MDVLRKELNDIYVAQGLRYETLSQVAVQEAVRLAADYAQISGCCVVVTDMAADRSFFLPGNVAHMLHLPAENMTYKEVDSSDEDFLYSRMYPEDLVDLRMLEYELFKMLNPLPAVEKTHYQAYATVRMHIDDQKTVMVNKGTRVMRLSPAGKMWLVCCTYDVPLCAEWGGTNPIIVNNTTGEIQPLSFSSKRQTILTDREKQVLSLIRSGMLSKEIACELGISQNTVHRHRQNILEKLSVDNSMEAVNAAIAMRLL